MSCRAAAHLAKKLLLDAADSSGQWWWTIVLQGGAAFTAGYVVLVLTNALRRPAAPVKLVKRVSRLSEFAALVLAVASLLLAFAALGPVPASLISIRLLPKELGPTLLVFLGGTLLALGLSRQSLFGNAADDGPVRLATVGCGKGFELADAFLRRCDVRGPRFTHVGGAVRLVDAGPRSVVSGTKDQQLSRGALDAGIYAYAKAGFGSYLGFVSVRRYSMRQTTRPAIAAARCLREWPLATWPSPNSSRSNVSSSFAST